MSAPPPTRASHSADIEEVRRKITPGRANPALTQSISLLGCAAPVRAGLYLLNGDWDAAHKVAQDIDGPLGAHWHALVHRHEPDYPNSKYWFSQVGQSPIYSRLAEAARAMSKTDLLRNGRWDAGLFTDHFAVNSQDPGLRKLDTLEQELLLEQCLAAAD
jgi:hypothetical protein